MFRQLCIVTLLACALTGAARQSIAQSSTRPLNRGLVAVFAQLDDERQSRRDQAISDLMGLGVDDLPTLRDVAVAAIPLSPSQRMALREIVDEVVARSLPCEMNPAVGFLGLHWELPMANDLGLPVDLRISGFAGNRFLHTGDIILKVDSDPAINCKDREKFIDGIKGTRPGTRLRLQILRHGALIHQDVVLDGFPSVVLSAQVDAAGVVSNWLETRQRQIDRYWTEVFSPPLLEVGLNEQLGPS